MKVTGPQRDLLSLLKRGFHIRYERLPQLARRTGADFDARTLDELRDMALAYARPTTPVVIALTLNGEQFCRNYLDQPAAAPLESRMRTADER